MWHALIAWPDETFGSYEQAMIPISAWSPEQRRLGHRVALRLLDGVGEGPDMWHEGEGVLHLRRRTSAEDRALLDPAWLAVPAVDDGGGEGLITPTWTP